jgi:hypothetical protein
LKPDLKKITGVSLMLYETKNKKYLLEKKFVARLAKLQYNSASKEE